MKSLFEYAQSLTAKEIPIIPTKNKKPILDTWADRRNKVATAEEMKDWYSNGIGKSIADGIAIPINNTEFAIDTDGRGETVFLTKLMKGFPEELRNKIKNTMLTKTPHGYHRTFRIRKEEFPDGIKSETIVKYNDHNEIQVVGKAHYLIVYGIGYEVISDIDNIITLSKEDAEKLVGILKLFRGEANGIKTTLGALKPHYSQPKRNDVVFALSGYLHKYGVPEFLIHDVVEQLATDNSDDEIPSRLRVVKNTCAKDASREEVSGYHKLLEALDNDKDAISEIAEVFRQLCPNSKFRSANRYSNGDGNDEDKDGCDVDGLRGIKFNVLSELGQHVYAVVSSSPPVLYLAHEGQKCIRKYIIKFDKVETTSLTGEKVVNRIQTLLPKQLLIYASPIKVVINENLMTDSRTYSITFQTLKGKKPFTITGTISEIIEILDKNGKILKKPEATDALTAIIRKYETSDMAEILEGITQPGYYWIDGKIRGYGINQRLDFDPTNIEEDRRAALECIEALEGLQLRSKKKVAFPTALKWTILAPFSFITKTRTRSIDDWLPWLYFYDTTDTGKTTLISNTALSVWGKNDKERDGIHFRGPGSLDSPSKLGITLSQTTYPILADEIGSIFNDGNILLDMVKYAIQSKYVRLKFNENILALGPLALTSNDAPPQDPAYRRRFVAIQFNDHDKWKESEKEDFKHWLSENHILDKLKTLGDFTTSYVSENPEILTYSSYTWHEAATKILKAFYASVGKGAPTWIDLVAEQNLVLEAGEEKQFELRGFLQQAIMEAYRREVYTNPDPATLDNDGKRIKEMSVSFDQKINYCLENKSVTFLHLVKRNSGHEREIAITSNIRSELQKYDRTKSVMTMNALASKIPGFESDLRNVGGARVRVICGPYSKFREFLNCEVRE
jgi:hypothetical protein